MQQEETELGRKIGELGRDPESVFGQFRCRVYRRPQIFFLPDCRESDSTRHMRKREIFAAGISRYWGSKKNTKNDFSLDLWEIFKIWIHPVMKVPEAHNCSEIHKDRTKIWDVFWTFSQKPRFCDLREIGKPKKKFDIAVTSGCPTSFFTWNQNINRTNRQKDIQISLKAPAQKTPILPDVQKCVFLHYTTLRSNDLHFARSSTLCVRTRSCDRTRHCAWNENCWIWWKWEFSSL